MLSKKPLYFSTFIDYSITATVEPSENIEVGFDEKIEVKCFGIGFPEPLVVWKDDRDSQLTETSANVSKIVFEKVDKSFRIHCHATSAAGAVFKTVNLAPSGKILF